MSLSVYQYLMTGQRNILATVWSSFYCVVCISTTGQVLISHIEVLPSRCYVLHHMHNSEASLPPYLVPHTEYSRCSTVSSVPTRTTYKTRCYIKCPYLGVTQVTHSFIQLQSLQPDEPVVVVFVTAGLVTLTRHYQNFNILSLFRYDYHRQTDKCINILTV